MFKKVFGFLNTKLFATLLLLVFFIVLSVLFWFWATSISFNDVYIFGNPFLRFGIIFILWLIIFLFFFLGPTINFFISLKSEKRAKLKVIKKESDSFISRAKRNFFISLQDAKKTWKKKIKFKKIPLVIVVGEEGAGKSTLINYSNIQYPLSDSLHSYKKLHQSTNNFSLYVSQNGALLDTEGNYFSQEKLFIPLSSDELPEDAPDKNKDFLIKKNIWKNFLSFLNKNFFHSKINGVVLVIDTRLFLSNPKEYSKDIIRYLVRRVNDCENYLNLRFPIYIVFSKIDLLDGMKEFFEIFNERITQGVLGITFRGKINANILDNELKQISQSLLLNFMDKNHFIYSLEDKRKTYLFLKQFDNLLSLVKNFLLETQDENAFKNNSSLRGVYFVSAYQENIPRNFLLDSVCEKYNIKKALAKPNPLHNKQSYFVKSLLEDIVFKDYSLSSMKNIFQKLSLLLLALTIGLGTYFLSFYFISKGKLEKEKAESALIALQQILLSDKDYKKMGIKEKANLLVKLKNTLEVYPELSKNNNLVQYPSLNISHKGFLEAQEFYYKLNEDVLKNTLIKEMEYILQTDKGDKNILIKTLYMYKSLFEQEYLNRNLLKIWINENWQLLSKYNISREDFLSGVNDIQKIDIEIFNKDKKSIELAIKTLQRTTTKPQRLYVLLNFLNSDRQKGFYDIKEELGNAANNVFAESSKLDSIGKIYTRNGMIGFLQNINQNIDDIINVESWMIESINSPTKENKSMLSIGVLKLYLEEYQNKWEYLLLSLAPKQYNSRESMLNQLNVLSKEDNPMLALIKIVSVNTKLNDAFLLREAYNIGLNANEIKTHFSNITSFFGFYHKIAERNSILNYGASAVGINIDNDRIMETIGTDIKNIQTKIIEFGTNNTQSIEKKIAYALNHKNEQDDPFTTFANNIKKLPPELDKYYAKLCLYAWNLVESQGVSLLNTAWFNEVYTPFMNDIAPFYPFNNTSTQELNMDSFKGFFGRNGAISKFYDKYLSSVLIKKANTYSLNTQSNAKINLSKNFLDFMGKTKNLSDLMLGSNDNIKINLTLQSLDLSADFSHIELQYNSHNARYDHTLHSTLQIIGEQFDSNTSLNLTAFGYHNSNLSYQKTYSGEWAWYRLLQENQNNGAYSIIFNDNEKLYFDFKLIGGASEASQILNTIQQIKVIESVTIGGNNGEQ